MRALLGSVERHPWLWALALLAPLVLFPAIDLTVAGWFYDPVHRTFPFRSHPLGEFMRKTLPKALFGLCGLVVALWAAGEAARRPLAGVTRRVALYVVLSLAVGPGLIVNTLLKDNWGRPRPSLLTEFGGTATYVRPLQLSDQCLNNCSFSSGHAALGFWVVCFAFLAPPRQRRPALAAALAVGAAMGLTRIAQGGHFLSDVAFSAVITAACSWGLYRWIVVPGRPNGGQK